MLETLSPNPVYDEDAHEAALDTLAALPDRGDVTIRVWGRDSCGDCRAVLPGFAAALEAVELWDHVEVYETDRDNEGELTEEYGVEFVPTIVIEVDGEEVARFVESEPVPAADYLADAIAGRRPGSGK